MNANNVYMYETNKEGIEKAKEVIKIGDTVLIKASNAMNFKEIAKALS